jgi:hypothetical protein
MSEAVENVYTPESFPKPEGFSFSKYKLALDESRNNIAVTLPCLLIWTKDCIEPEVDAISGAKKWSLSLAIEKGEGDALIKELKSSIDKMMKADGVKGAFPNCIKDGAAQDSDGNYFRSGGRLMHYHYANAKTKQPPKVLTREDGDLITLPDTSQVISGTYAMIAGTIIPVNFGEGGKRGASLWFNKILLCGGGRPLGGNSRSDEDDFGGFVGGSSDAAGFF